MNLATEYIITPKWIALLELTSTWDAGRLIGHQANVSPAARLSTVPGIEYVAADESPWPWEFKSTWLGKTPAPTSLPCYPWPILSKTATGRKH